MDKNKNDVVIVELDRPRELRFGHKALKRLSAFSSKSVEDMEEDAEIDLEELETIFYYGLEKDARENGEHLTLDMMEDILDCAPSYAYLMEKMQEAMQIAMGGFAGNAQTPGKPAPSRRNGTGRKA